ncbi:atp synthase delta mitochondrial precursor [Stemphylium lycopersici]|nr:atp synthase delta mitochondrial precursor [Stemphylium lycopersici]
MSSLRIARAALRARPAAIARPIQRRGYAEVANDKIKLSLALPHQSIYKSQDVVQVNLPAETGEMGVLANHVASIEQLKPGLVEIIEEQGGSKQFFLSGGFAVVQPNSVLSINAVEGYPLEDFSAEAVRNQMAEAQKIAGGNGSETDIAEAKIELEQTTAITKGSKTPQSTLHMPPGFDQPTSSSTSRAINTGFCEQTSPSQTIRRRLGRFENPVPVTCPKKSNPSPLVPTQNDATDPPTLTLPEQPIRCQRTSPTGRKSPAYLQGKNPYGQVLERIEHPYRKPRTTASEAEAPFELSPDADRQPNTPGGFGHRLRTLVQDPRSTDLQSHQQPAEAPFKPRKPVSVRSIKNSYEIKFSQHPRGSALLPSALAPCGRTSVPSPELIFPSMGVDPHTFRLDASQTSDKEQHNNGLLLQHLTASSSSTVDAVQYVVPYAQGGTNDYVPGVVITNDTSSKPLSHEHGHISPENAQEFTDHRRPMNILANQNREAKPTGSKRVADKSLQPDAISNAPPDHKEPIQSINQSRTSKDTVRRPTIHKSMIGAEISEVGTSGLLSQQQESRRAKSSRDIRRTFEDRGTSLSPVQSRRSRCAALTEDGSHSDSLAARRSSKTSSPNFEIFRNKFNRPSDVSERAAHIVSLGLSHDGTSSPSPSRGNSPSIPVPIANIGIEAQYNDVEVPDHVDDRQGFGRRITQDFGFPGAHIRPRGITTKRPLQDPGKWVKRACGHFSYMCDDEHREQAQTRRCRQCSTRLPPRTQAAYLRRARRRTATGSINSVSSSSNKLKLAGTRSSDCCRHHAQQVPNDQCGDGLANDLGRIIDSILKEHANTLQSVIDTIKLSQPGIVKVRKVSRDIITQCQLGGVCANPSHLVCSSDSECQPTVPLLPPKAAERLNVGSQGQLGPNLNDPCSRLREAVKTVPDLLHLVNSAADDFGIDLDRRPTPKDEVLFRNAPYESTSCASVSSRLDMPLGNTEENARSNALLSEDDWPQETRRHLTDLSDTRDWLMYGLESIAGDLSVSLSEDEDIRPGCKHAKFGLNERSFDLSGDPTRLDNNANALVSEDVAKITEERDRQRPAPARARTSTCSTLTSHVTEHLRESEDTPPRQI